MLAVAGARVIVSDVREDAARMTRDYVVENGGEAIAVPADITREEDVRELVAAAVAAFGGVDVLVNNGGGSLARDVDIVTMDVGVWDAIMALNARGPMLCCKYAIPEMLKRGRGAIVNISSGAALSGQLGIPAYSAAKAAVIALTRSIATLHGQQGIRCNAITPGLIMHERLAEIFPAEQVRVDAENILTPSPGTPEDIGATVVFLASEQARFINAQVLPVDGGLLAHTPTYAQTRAMVSKRLEVKERS
jgi:NAD(P)-dependent dehydrogenase (short-subunit alcohol dehydrogenase family)